MFIILVKLKINIATIYSKTVNVVEFQANSLSTTKDHTTKFDTEGGKVCFQVYLRTESSGNEVLDLVLFIVTSSSWKVLFE